MHTALAKTILIVDDDSSLTQALSVRLGHEGYRCVTAGNAAEGVAEFDRGGIDLVITDLNMPGGDGVDLLESMRKVGTVPLIVITGFKDDFKRRLRSVENVIVLRKPFEPGELVGVVGATLERDRDVRAAGKARP